MITITTQELEPFIFHCRQTYEGLINGCRLRVRIPAAVLIKIRMGTDQLIYHERTVEQSLVLQYRFWYTSYIVLLYPYNLININKNEAHPAKVHSYSPPYATNHHAI